MPTTPLAGDRARRARNPRDITGTRHRELLAEKAARDAAATVDIHEVQRRSREAGYSDGYTKGLSDGWDACIAALVAEGVLDADDARGDGDGAE